MKLEENKPQYNLYSIQGLETNKQTNNNKGRFLKNLTLHAILNMKLAGFAVNSVVAVPSNNISYENNETLKDKN